jgi:hypothetical protein
MPFVNGKFYMNPAYGRAIENARANESTDGDQGGHWVTIGGRHVLMDDEQAGSRGRDGQGASQSTRDRIAEIAKKYNGSTDWAYAKQKGNFARNTNKCNKYVYDVTKEAGAEASVTGSDGKQRPPLAGEWADPNTKIANWRVVGQNEESQPGDVAAYKLPGHASYTGHSGIVTSVDQNGSVQAMAAHEKVVGPDDKFNPGVGAAVIAYRRFTGDQ